jgi:hypothetical protein
MLRDNHEEGPTGEMWEWLATLRGLDLTDAEVEAAAQRLLADPERALPILLAQFTDPTEDPALLAVTTVALKGWAAPYPVKPLTLLLRSKDVGALGKALIMTVLERYGMPADNPDILGVGINLEEFEIDGTLGERGASQN